MSQTSFVDRQGEEVQCNEQLYDQITENETGRIVSGLLSHCADLLMAVGYTDDESWRELEREVKFITDNIE